MEVTTRTERDQVAAGPEGGWGLRLGPSATGRRRRASWIVAGLLLALVAGLAFAVLLSRAADREPMLAAARDVARGQVLGVEDVAVVEVAAEVSLAAIPAAERSTVVGRTVTADLTAGQLLSAGQLADGQPVPDGMAVVGLALTVGQYPTGMLAPGDRVAVVRTGPSGTPAAAERPGPVLLADAAEVFAVEPVDSAGAAVLSVSLLVDAGQAAAVADAAAADLVRLLLVAG